MRVVLEHKPGVTSPARAPMRLSDLQRPDTARSPDFIPTDTMLRHIALVAERKAAFESACHVRRPAPADGGGRLAELLRDIETSAGAVTDADKVVNGMQSRRMARVQAQFNRWEVGVYAPRNRAACDAVTARSFPQPPRVKSDSEVLYSAGLRAGGSSGLRRVSLQRVPAECWNLEGGADRRHDTEARLHSALCDVDGVLGNTSSGAARPAKHDAGGASATPPSVHPFRPMLPAVSWSQLAVRGSDIGHVNCSAWTSGAGMHAPVWMGGLIEKLAPSQLPPTRQTPGCKYVDAAPRCRAGARRSFGIVGYGSAAGTPACGWHFERLHARGETCPARKHKQPACNVAPAKSIGSRLMLKLNRPSSPWMLGRAFHFTETRDESSPFLFSSCRLGIA